MRRAASADSDLLGVSDALHRTALEARELLSVSAALPAPVPRPDAGLADDVRLLLSAEARLLDQRSWRRWLDLYRDDAFWWIPCEDAFDPTTDVSILLDDAARMRRRIDRLESGFALAQSPRSRTTRSITDVEVADDPRDPARVLALSALMLSEMRAGTLHLHPARCIHLLERDSLRLCGKVVLLLRRESVIDNLTFIV